MVGISGSEHNLRAVSELPGKIHTGQTGHTYIEENKVDGIRCHNSESLCR